ncbi:amidohydrolase family protein [Aquamicrobium sp. LC103]|uniref:amidohydrolase family protein n=1 Tax=Aquamicrobium sp. LC103 TaxID=1120658 RepID=UPI00063EAB41|nr:amidohydrolase family protein [Aquamicrobium sp. LC103]TKT74737.1 amidohydrolase [Aquamicrobium sp. LC103]
MERSRTIDAHCHYWSLARDDYGWLTAGDPALAAIRRDFGPDDLPREAKEMRARVLVQAAPTVAETRYLLEIAGREKDVAGVVGWVDLASPESVETLEGFAADPLFKGVRPMLQDLPDADWILTRPHTASLGALTRLGLRFDALVTPVQLDGLRRFVEANPDLPVIVDHAAKPPFAVSPDDPRHAVWRRCMARLSEAPQVFCKLSGLLTELPEERRGTPRTAAEALRPTFESLLGWFGPERLAWGSDWPVLTLAADYDFWLETTDLLLASLDEVGRDAILAGVAARFYGIEEKRR